jgi:hypothetical protein
MKLYQSIIATGALIATVGLTACGPSLEGIVKEEFGSAQQIADSSDDSAANPTYGIVLEAGKKEYTLAIVSRKDKPVLALAKAIEVGDTIKIKRSRDTHIDKDNIGETYSTNVVLQKKATE